MPKRFTFMNSGSLARREFMSTAVPIPASDHWAKIASARIRAGSAIRSSETMAPAKSSCGITASGIRLVAWSWVRTTDETSRPIVTEAIPVATSRPNTVA